MNNEVTCYLKLSIPPKNLTKQPDETTQKLNTYAEPCQLYH